MKAHCPGCHGHVYDERQFCDEHTLDGAEEYHDCPGCQECVRLKDICIRMCQALGISTDRDEEVLVNACERLRAKFENTYRASIGEVWYWQGDEYDHPELLTCPVLMSADQMREFIAMRARLAKAERLCDVVVRCEQGRGRFSCTHLHDPRCNKDRGISDVCTCGGDEYQESLAAWEEEHG